MSKNNTTEDFDLYIKRSLQDAEEAPSPAVWEAIESRLDAAAAAPRHFRWGWVAAAAAAALTAILVIPETGNSNLNDNTTAAHEMLALAEPAQIQTAELPAPRALKNLGKKDSSSSNALPETLQSQETLPAESEQMQQTSRPASGPAASEPENPAAQQSSRDETAQTDAFAEMAYNDSQTSAKGVRVSALLQGSLGGNETSARGAAYGTSSPGFIENNITETSASNYGIPFSVGLGVQVNFTPRLAIRTGLDFSYLTRSFAGVYQPEAGTPVSGDIRHDMSYIGVPVALSFDLLKGSSLSLYILGIGEAEWCLGNSYHIRQSGETVTEKISGVQWSAGGGFGVEYRLSKLLGLYVDPTVRYYFDCGQPNNVRTERPLMLNLNAGLRFKF